MKRVLIGLIGIALTFGMAGLAMGSVVTIDVPGTACPSFAGQTSISPTIEGDGTSEIPPFVDITGFPGGTIASITATGSWAHADKGASYWTGPDGKTYGDPTHVEYEVYGISSLLGGPLNLLVGVFLTNDLPVPGNKPSSLTFGTDMTTPVLQQIFAIGSSLDGITIPTGATRLFFGLNNGYEWNNNAGWVNVTVTPIPEPATMLLLGSGLLGLAGLSTRRRRKL